MSFIITVHTNEGIIMASDSRTTYNFTNILADGTIKQTIGSQITDTTYKTFLCNSRIGISTCGAANINQIPVAGYIEKFIAEKVSDESTVDSISQDLMIYFDNLCSGLEIDFLVAGYNKGNLTPKVNQVFVSNKNIKQQDTSCPGAIWDGEITTLSKLVMPIGIKQIDVTYIDMRNNRIGFNFFTLQDAINFANYAVDITIKTMAFENCAKTVGGPIDILAIKPNNAFWIARKELHA